MIEMKENAVEIGKHIWQDSQGYWYTDEVEQANGPFISKELAEDTLGAYCHFLETNEVLTPEEWRAMKEGK